MKNFLSLLLVFMLAITSICSCSKEQIQKKEESMAISLITDGSWIITKFSEGPDEITSSFSGWECHFGSDKTCEAINGTSHILGTWNASVVDRSITSQFPAGSGILEKINGTWQIIRTNESFGEFSQTKDGLNYSMELTKK